MILRRALLTALFLFALAVPAQASIVYHCQKGDLCVPADDGSDPVVLTTDKVGYFHPSLSADGKTLATSSNDGTILYDMVTRERTALGGDFAFDLALSPDGTLVADNSGMCDCAFHAIVCVSPVGNVAQKVCDKQEQAVTNGHDFGPDGRLYTAQSAGKRSFRVSLDKKARKQLRKKGKLKVTLTVTVTPPNGGLAGSETKTLTLKD